MSESEKSIRLVTALVECRPDGEYAPWGIKWYDGTGTDANDKPMTINGVRMYRQNVWIKGRELTSQLGKNLFL